MVEATICKTKGSAVSIQTCQQAPASSAHHYVYIMSQMEAGISSITFCRALFVSMLGRHVRPFRTDPAALLHFLRMMHGTTSASVASIVIHLCSIAKLYENYERFMHTILIASLDAHCPVSNPNLKVRIA
jgi:hypothetical protein